MSARAAARLAAGVILVVLGSLSLVTAVLAAGVASTVEASVGRSGVVSQSLGTIRSGPSDVAVVADGVSARFAPPEIPDWAAGALTLAGTDTTRLAGDVGDFVLIATAPTGTGVFIGTAPTEAVNAYLDGSPYSVAILDGEQWPTVAVPGEGAPSPPEDAGIWTLSGSGSPAVLPADRLQGETLVLIREDLEPPVEAALRLEYRVPGASTVLESAAITAAAGSVGGLMLILAGGWLIVGPRGRHR